MNKVTKHEEMETSVSQNVIPSSSIFEGDKAMMTRALSLVVSTPLNDLEVIEQGRDDKHNDLIRKYE